MADFAPTHPGEILKTEFLDPLGISQYHRIAKVIDVPARRINEIVHGKRGISADTALRLSRALGLSDMFWINMQAHYDAELRVNTSDQNWPPSNASLDYPRDIGRGIASVADHAHRRPSMLASSA